MMFLVIAPPRLILVAEKNRIVVDGAGGDVDEEGEGGVDLYFQVSNVTGHQERSS